LKTILTKNDLQNESVSDSEATVRNNIQRSLAKKLQSLSMAFRSSQREYMTKLKMQKTGDGFDFLSEEDPNKMKNNIDSGFTEQQLAVLEQEEALVNERDEEINNIVKSIEELSAIFKELAVLVIDQGTILDRIDFNMEQVVEHTKEGVEQLEKAEKYQKSARSMKCIFCLIFMICIMFIVLILKHTEFKDNGGKGKNNVDPTDDAASGSSRLRG